MPRKKRTRRRDTDDDGSAFPSKRRHTDNDELLIISDSENEEEEHRPAAREGRLRGRETRTQARVLCPDRDVVSAELTEEEMMELAVRLSEREAGNAALRRQQQEEEDMRLAIAQSLHANGMQANSEDCESLPLVMTPVGGSQPLAGQSPTPAAESPAFPPRKKPLSMSLSNRKRDVSTEDQFTMATGVGVAQRGRVSDPPSQSADPSESPPIGTDTPLSAPPASEAVGPSQGEALGSDSEGESRGSSAGGPSQAGGPSHRPVLRIEKLSQALEQDCRSAGFVLCSQSDPAKLPASGASPSSPPPSPEPPQSPTFPRSDRREDGRGPGGARNSPETAAAALCAPRGGEEASVPPPHRKGRPPGSQGCSEPTHRSHLEPLVPRGVILKGKREDGSRDHGGSDREQSQSSTSSQPAHGVSERTAGGTLQVALQPGQDFSTQMTLHWEDNEDEESPVENEECPIVAQTPSPPRSQSAVCEQSSYSESESLLRDVPGSVPSPVFPRDASRNPATPLSGLAPPSAPRAGVSGARGIRRKITFRNMYAPIPAVPSGQGEPSCSGGRGPGASPSLQAPAQPPKEEQGAGQVLYYWGVPFCPRGQNPDDYTQVILTQLEVYEKSLKSAQRGLLRKAEWGEPVLPGPLKRPFCRRARLKRSRPARPLRNEEEEEEEEDPGEAAEEEEEEERGGSQKGSEAVGGDREGGAPDSEALETPSQTLPEEPKSSLDSNFVPEEPPDKFRLLRRRALRDRSPPQPETQLLEHQEEEEEEEGMCPETQMSEENTQDVNMESPAASQPRPESEVMEVEQEEVEEVHSQPTEAAAGGEEATMEVEVTEQEAQDAQGRSGRVECPICMHGFPLSQIEMHAAYCDGSADTEESCSQTQAMVLRKSTRRTEEAEEDRPSTRLTRAPLQEKCFLCHGLFPVPEYDSHVEACIQKSTRTNQGAKSLLTALDRSEQKDSEAGPSHSYRRKEISAESGGSRTAGFSVSDSPIKAFTPISEATDCLVDFKRQLSAKPSQRAGRKRKFHR
ncbi:BRCA1-A complex subunit RAP80 isoform X1 [Anguilla rostrata]|uniref:BRCA1-A complex subunit RAP80 isoform X1 n=1 Tax=Anguilla rostrata TaxID=7938 RepID=UPI0030CC0641